MSTLNGPIRQLANSLKCICINYWRKIKGLNIPRFKQPNQEMVTPNTTLESGDKEVCYCLSEERSDVAIQLWGHARFVRSLAITEALSKGLIAHFQSAWFTMPKRTV